MTFGSLFAGIRGFDLGFIRAGAESLYAAEIDAKCNSVARRQFPGERQILDVKEVNESTGRPDVICGGFPCQDLSVAGKRAGLAGERSGLWWEFHRVIAGQRPQWVLVENVPGLLSSNKGRDMGALLGSLEDLGYGAAYRVLDSQWFGVAQRRRRVFIVGCAGGAWERAAQVLFEPEGVPWDPSPSREAGPEAAGAAEGCTGEECFGFSSKDYGADAREGVAPTLRAMNHAAVAYQCHGSNVGPMGTLRSGNGNATGGVPFVERREVVRRLTPTECERLQGFPDGWTEFGSDGKRMSDTARCKMLGNAVTVNVAEWLAKRIVEAA